MIDGNAFRPFKLAGAANHFIPRIFGEADATYLEN